MKKIFLLASAALVLCAVSCKKDTPAPTPTPTAISVSPLVANAPFAGGDVEFEVKGDEEWVATLSDSSVEVEWATVTPASGKGAATIKVTTTANPSFTDERSIVLNVKSATKTAQARITQAPGQLGEGEVLILGLDGVSRVFATANLAEAGKFADDIEAVGSLFQWNSKKAWPYDLEHSAGAFNGGPRDDSMVPIAGFVDACNAYQYTHEAFDEEGNPIVDPFAWAAENDPCPEGWCVPSQNDLIQTIGWGNDGAGTSNYNGARIEAGERGFSVMGFVIGLGTVLPDDLTKDNITEKGGIFIPRSGWINNTGYIDRDWLVCLRGASSLNQNMGGLYLSTKIDYCDEWGWGDGQKERATAVRCMKKF